MVSHGLGYTILLVRLHAQLNPIKAIVRICSAIGHLQLSEYTWRWVIRFIGRNMSCSGTIGGAVPISTSGNRATGWPLYVTTNNKLGRRSTKMFSADSWKRQLSVHLGSISFLRRSIVPTSRRMQSPAGGAGPAGGGVRIRPRGRNNGASEKWYGPQVKWLLSRV